MEDNGIPEPTPDMDGEVGMGPPLLFGPRGRFGADVAAVAAEDSPPAPDAWVVAPTDADDGDARNGMAPGLDEVEAMRRLTDGSGARGLFGHLRPGQGGFDSVCAGRGMDEFSRKQGGSVVEDDTMFRLVVVDGSVAMSKRGKRFC